MNIADSQALRHELATDRAIEQLTTAAVVLRLAKGN
jgi:hypothetical protein